MVKLGEDEEEEKKILGVFIGITIVELKKKTLEDLSSTTIKENRSERNYWLPFYVEVNPLFIVCNQYNKCICI